MRGGVSDRRRRRFKLRDHGKGAGGAALVRNERDLAAALKRLFADDKTRQAMADTARDAAKASAERVLADVVGALNAKFAGA